VVLLCRAKEAGSAEGTTESMAGRGKMKAGEQGTVKERIGVGGKSRLKNEEWE
jgi:hypothetical protein